ncbi:MAG: hypothetical protein A2268_15135 [Candidatus Raymondbacteria bacterium RifOxyA12_full_50_37]|nr:MAG: hypothetical protein A2268_15135 [Candidatus Raymondbacteria bacterium RifOxyA12_full_50_37]OGJ88509.1 MAG: hypothetical protein A2248_20125 [Candidatus Raymondbacteria bacterium RIFOXYA2_FULL_49_16]OGJ90608.1 MAG: hypothetical protein A2350_18385 [Candidatus Raymondbacteria bacterium RifOxyB12_full_50_8]OGJ98970.1 MAG: hypothetical protein A2453_10845 [Candidatus Raymondbacteria bacterium RIFOXYC2_FULL_50_21]OGK00608.1 MAG: hypothetical protein A2487_13690 [Candidatus Raymondbacteria b
MGESGKMTKNLYRRIVKILDAAKVNAVRSVNSTQVVANWLIGREIVEEEQEGRFRAEYGKRSMEELAERLSAGYGHGYSLQNLFYMRQFYAEYPALLKGPRIFHASRGKSIPDSRNMEFPIFHALRGKSWVPGSLNPNLSWTHYRTLLRVKKEDARAFYEIEAVKNNWFARELERQINSLFFERLALSRDKKGLRGLAAKGHEIKNPSDAIKDPVVLEFLGIPESPKLVETTLEEALINNLQTFLLEMGKGFAFVARQDRITLDGDHFYVDLVFYHTMLKRYVLIDLKVGKLTHQDLGQLQLYVNYFDRERLAPGDNNTIGLILCTDKNDAVVKYTLGTDDREKIFASRYRLLLPTEAELKAEIKREMMDFSGTGQPVAHPAIKKRGKK